MSVVRWSARRMSERAWTRSLIECEPDSGSGQLEIEAHVRRGNFDHHAILVLHDHRRAASEHRHTRSSGDVRTGEVIELLEFEHGAIRSAPREARFAERQSEDLDGVFPSM